MKLFTLKEALRVRDMREARYGTEDVMYVVDRIGHGKYTVVRRERIGAHRHMFSRRRRSQ